MKTSQCWVVSSYCVWLTVNSVALLQNIVLHLTSSPSVREILRVFLCDHGQHCYIYTLAEEQGIPGWSRQNSQIELLRLRSYFNISWQKIIIISAQDMGCYGGRHFKTRALRMRQTRRYQTRRPAFRASRLCIRYLLNKAEVQWCFCDNYEGCFAETVLRKFTQGKRETNRSFYSTWMSYCTREA